MIVLRLIYSVSKTFLFLCTVTFSSSLVFLLYDILPSKICKVLYNYIVLFFLVGPCNWWCRRGWQWLEPNQRRGVSVKYNGWFQKKSTPPWQMVTFWPPLPPWFPSLLDPPSLLDFQNFFKSLKIKNKCGSNVCKYHLRLLQHSENVFNCIFLHFSVIFNNSLLDFTRLPSLTVWPWDSRIFTCSRTVSRRKLLFSWISSWVSLFFQIKRLSDSKVVLVIMFHTEHIPFHCIVCAQNAPWTPVPQLLFFNTWQPCD